VLPKKRLVLIAGLVACVFVGLSVQSEAQIRRGRPGRSVVVVRGYYGFADPFWYGYGYPYFGYQYPFGPYGPYGYPYRYYSYDPGAAVRLEVEPKDAEVYVDGYYAGIVDDFDGVFQRLRLPPGQHELILYRDGLRTVHQTVYLTVDSTFKVKYKMEKLAAGDIAEARPTPPPPPPQPALAGPGQPGFPQQGPPQQGPRRGPYGRRPLPPNQGEPRGTIEASAYGTLSIRVQPGDATVTVDGERWAGPQGQDRLVVEVAEGTHRIQIQKDGFESFSTDVTIRRGETTPLNVSLRTR
jgi:PEGA domain